MERWPKLALRKGDALALQLPSEKKIQREEEAKKKAEERELKKAEQERKKPEKEQERLEKVIEREKKAELCLQQKGGEKSTRSCNKENVPSAPTACFPLDERDL